MKKKMLNVTIFKVYKIFGFPKILYIQIVSFSTQILLGFVHVNILCRFMSLLKY